MVKLNQEQFKQLHALELELLVEVDRICKKYGITYTLYAGTLLGAVRHEGFIPWDDDADIAMLRRDYEKFRKVCKTELDDERFYFQDHRNTKGYRWGYAKLRRKNTLYLRQHQEQLPYKQGLGLDIFPMDNVPDNYIHRALYNFFCFCIRKVLYSPVGMLGEKTLILRKFYKCLFTIFGDSIFNIHNNCVRKSTKIKSKWVRVLTFPTATKAYGYRKKWFENVVPMTFEGIELMGMKDAHEYLRFAYGDYMTPPKPEDRKVHPALAVKLNLNN